MGPSPERAPEQAPGAGARAAAGATAGATAAGAAAPPAACRRRGDVEQLYNVVPPATVDGFLFVDLETSESDSRKGRIIQIAVTACDSNLRELESESWYVDREGNSIKYWASRIHGITDTTLDSRSPPSQQAVFTQLVHDFIPRHFGPDLTAVLVAHNGFTCDFKWLIHTFERLRLALPPQVGGVCPG